MLIYSPLSLQHAHGHGPAAECKHPVRRRSFDSDTSYWSFARNRLFKRIGARSFTFQVDPSGTFLGGSHVFMTARDWARFGQLYLQVGRPLSTPGLSHMLCRPRILMWCPCKLHPPGLHCWRLRGLRVHGRAAGGRALWHDR